MNDWIDVDDICKPPVDTDIQLMTTEGQAVGVYDGRRYHVSGSVDTSYDMAVPVLLGSVTHWKFRPEDPVD